MMIVFVVADDLGDRWLNYNADDGAAERSDPVDHHVLVYWSTTAAEGSHAGHQRMCVEPGVVHRCSSQIVCRVTKVVILQV